MAKKKKSDVYCVIGLGRFGSAAAKYLADAGCEVMVIDAVESKVRELRPFTELAFVTNDLGIDNLREMGVGDCSTVIIGIGGAIDVSVLTALHVINLGVPRVIAKAVSMEHGELLQKLGAESIYPERDMAIRLGKQLTTNTVMEYISLSNNMEISEVEISGWLSGKTLMDAALREKYSVNIIALSHSNDGEVETNLDPNAVLREGDVMVVLGKSDDIRRFENDL